MYGPRRCILPALGAKLGDSVAGGTIEEESEGMLTLTEKAVGKVKEVMAEQQEPYAGIRVAVVGGGCSGFQYAMNLEKDAQNDDKVIEIDGFKVFVDDASMNYLSGTEIDYVETVQGSGITFKNPNANSCCGWGESFHA